MWGYVFSQEEEEKEEDTRALKISHWYSGRRRRERRDALLFLRLSKTRTPFAEKREKRETREMREGVREIISLP